MTDKRVFIGICKDRLRTIEKKLRAARKRGQGIALTTAEAVGAITMFVFFLGVERAEELADEQALIELWRKTYRVCVLVCGSEQSVWANEELRPALIRAFDGLDIELEGLPLQHMPSCHKPRSHYPAGVHACQ